MFCISAVTYGSWVSAPVSIRSERLGALRSVETQVESGRGAGRRQRRPRATDGEGMTGRAAVGAFGIVVVIVVGFVASLIGFATCLNEVQSGKQAPHLCGSVGTATALWLPPVIGAVVVLLLLAAGLRTRMLALVTGLIVAAEVGLVVMWALVSHGTIHY